MKDMKYLCDRFDSALYALPGGCADILRSIPDKIKANTEEIRLRAAKPLLLTVGGAPMWVGMDGSAGYLPPATPLYITPEQINTTYLNLCNHSIYSHTEEIKQGFIMMKDSHRAGICGTVTSNGLRDISSINIRIAKQILGCADRIVSRFHKGMLIAGPPGSGKTTLLRDTVRQLSARQHKRVTVIDSRGEIAAVYGGVATNELGENTDIITGADKAAGIEMAVRTMYPQIVAFDEIGSLGEVDMVIKGLNSGVSVITTAHIGEKQDLLRRDVTNKLLSSGAVSHIALLEKPGGEIQIIKTEELLAQCV